MVDVVVTGSSGFIGSNLIPLLTQTGYDTCALDIKPPEFEVPEAVQWRTVDLTGEFEFPEADIIVHLAAHSQVQATIDEPDRSIENMEMTLQVLEEANRIGARVVNASSRDVYGSVLKPTEEKVTPDSPNPYAAGKLGSEALANAFYHTNDVPVTSLRIANVYGPKDTNRRVLPIFIAEALAGRELTVYGAEKVIDFIHVDDICQAILTAISRPDCVNGEAINLGSGTGTTLTEVAEHIAAAIEPCPGWRLSSNRRGDVSQYVSNNSKAQRLLDYSPTLPFDRGLGETIDWYERHPEVRNRILPQP